MDADAASASDIPDDLVSRNRLAALRIANHQPIDALNANALRLAAHLVHDPLERTRLRLPRHFVFRVELLENLDDVDVALPDRRDEMRGVTQMQRARNLEQIVLARLAEAAAP